MLLVCLATCIRAYVNHKLERSLNSAEVRTSIPVRSKLEVSAAWNVDTKEGVLPLEEQQAPIKAGAKIFSHVGCLFEEAQGACLLRK